MGTPAEQIKPPSLGSEEEVVAEKPAEQEEGEEEESGGTGASTAATASDEAVEQQASWGAASVLTEAGQCLDEMFRTAVLCFYEPYPEGEEEEEERKRREQKKQEEEEARRKREQAEKEEEESPGFAVKVGRTVITPPAAAASAAESGGGGAVTAAMALDFGDVPVGKTVNAMVRVENRRHPFVDYSVRCSFAPVTNCRLRVDGGRPFSGYAVQGALRQGESRELEVEASPSKPGPIDEAAMTVSVGGAVHEIVIRAKGVDTRQKG